MCNTFTRTSSTDLQNSLHSAPILLSSTPRPHLFCRLPDVRVSLYKLALCLFTLLLGHTCFCRITASVATGTHFRPHRTCFALDAPIRPTLSTSFPAHYPVSWSRGLPSFSFDASLPSVGLPCCSSSVFLRLSTPVPVSIP